MARIVSMAPVAELETDEKLANEIFDLVDRFASYGFNKSHAAAYGVLSYQTAWLKRHLPHEFITANLNIEMADVDKMAGFIEEALRMKLKVRGPDVNASEPVFAIEGEGAEQAIRYGLAGIRACGRTAMDTLVAERKANGRFASLDDLIKRTQGPVNKSAYEALIKAGACDGFSRNRASLLAALPEALKRAQNGAGQATLFEALGSPSLPQVPMPGAIDLLAWEIETMGMCLSAAPRQGWDQIVRRRGCMSVARIRGADASSLRRATVAGIVTDIQAKISKAKKPFTIVNVADPSGTMELMMFNEAHENFRSVLAKGKPFLFELEISARDERVSYFVRNVEPFT